MGTVVLSLLAVLALVLARAAELPWRGVLHWTGEVLLVVGILLAAKGISDVRREWTGLPGMRGRAAQAMRAIRLSLASWAWERWNRFAEKNWLARRLGLRPRMREVTGSGDITLALHLCAHPGRTGGRPNGTGK